MICKYDDLVIKDGKFKKKMKICKYNSIDDQFDYDINWKPRFIGDKKRSFLIPCGQCIGCRLDYSREWANRMMLELDSHKSAYFITLTYNDKHLPTACSEHGCLPTLSKRDIQLFMKRLRKAYSKIHEDAKLRFYCSGEYGDLNGRPHYHMIIYGLELDDLVYYKHSELINGRYFSYYLSPFLESVWSVDDESLGYVVVAECTWETCAYTARYVMKKLKGKDAIYYSERKLTPPFALMSRMPGIGGLYYHDHPDMYEHSYISIPTANGGRQITPPKYIDKLFEKDFPDVFEEIKEIRTTASQEKVKAKLAETSLTYSQLLEVEERNLKDKIKTLRRKI